MGNVSASAAHAQREYINTRDAAKRLNRSVKTIYRYVEMGDLTGYKVGKTRLILLDREEVEALARIIPNARS